MARNGVLGQAGLSVHRLVAGCRDQRSKITWNNARERANVPSLLVHDLRRTAVRNMIRAGIPEKQAMRISGHKSRSIFDCYDITDERDIQLAGQRLARYLEEKGKVVTKEVTALDPAALPQRENTQS